MPDDKRPKHPTKTNDAHHTSDPADGEKTLEENEHLSASGLSWDETRPKPGETFNRATEMGEAD